MTSERFSPILSISKELAIERRLVKLLPRLYSLTPGEDLFKNLSCEIADSLSVEGASIYWSGGGEEGNEIFLPPVFGGREDELVRDICREVIDIGMPRKCKGLPLALFPLVFANRKEQANQGERGGKERFGVLVLQIDRGDSIDDWERENWELACRLAAELGVLFPCLVRGQVTNVAVDPAWFNLYGSVIYKLLTEKRASINAAVMFCDVAGSTNFLSRHPKEGNSVLASYIEAAAEAAAEYSLLPHFEGDCLMAIVPILGDKSKKPASLSVMAAFAVNKRVAELRRKSKFPLSIRTGIALGPVDIRMIGSPSIGAHYPTPMGLTVHTAKRVEGMAEHDGILVTDEVLNRCFAEGTVLKAKAIEGVFLDGITTPDGQPRPFRLYHIYEIGRAPPPIRTKK